MGIREKMLPRLERLRTLAPSSRFNVYVYRSVEIVRRFWSGGRPGAGTLTIYRLPLVNHESNGTAQPVKVVAGHLVSNSPSLGPQSGGTVEGGGYSIGPLTPRCYRADLGKWVGYFPNATLSRPAAPTITNVGTAGGTTWRYRIYAVTEPSATDQDQQGGCSDVSPLATTATGNATLSANNYNRLSWTAVAGASLYRVFRESYNLAVSPLTVGLIGETTGTTFNDTGLAGDGASSIAPVLYQHPTQQGEEVALVLTGREGSIECTLTGRTLDRGLRIMLSANRNKFPPPGV